MKGVARLKISKTLEKVPESSFVGVVQIHFYPPEESILNQKIASDSNGKRLRFPSFSPKDPNR